MDEMESGYKMLGADDPIIKGIINQNKIVPLKNGEPAVEPGSRVRLPKVAPETYKTKKVQVELTPEQQTTLIREGAQKGRDLKEHLQCLVNEFLSTRVGKTTIKSASFMATDGGKKIVGPSRDFGKE